MPVTVSSFALSLLMDHEGVIRRSDEVFSETTRKGTSAMVCVVVWDANVWRLLGIGRWACGAGHGGCTCACREGM